MSDAILLNDIQPVARGSFQDQVYSEATTEGQTRVGASKVGLFAVYRYTTNRERWQLIICMSCALVAGTALPLVTLVFGSLMDHFMNANSDEEVETHGIQNSVRHLSLCLVYIAIGSLVSTMVSTWGFNRLGERITTRLQQEYLAAVLQQDLGYFQIVGVGELTSGIDKDMKLIQEGISQKMSMLISGISGFIAAIIISFRKNPRFAGIMLSQPLALMLVVGGLGSWLSQIQREGQVHWVKADNLAQDVLGAIRNVLSYRSQERFADKYQNAIRQPIQLELRERMIFGIMVAGSFTVLHWANGLGFWQADHLVHQGKCTIAEALTIQYATTVAGGMLSQALPFLPAMFQAHGAATRVCPVINRTLLMNPSSIASRIIDPFQGRIEFRDVRFAYPSRPDQLVLNGLTFTVSASQTVAFVGSSGSGKSTIFSLLERLYLPSSGGITLDHEPIEKLDVSWLRVKIGYVDQDVALFQASIHDNIAYGLHASFKQHMTREAIRQRVIQAAEIARVDAFISALPDGYDTVLGAGGSGLSGGQRQRIAIARAVVSQPPILLLDEATAALDSKSEKEVQKALDAAMKGRTTIVIAHRLSTIQRADKIMVMHNGQIVNQGSHAELMLQSELYQALVRQQELKSHNVVQEESHTGVYPLPSDTPIEDLKYAASPLTLNHKSSTAAATIPASPHSIEFVWSLNKPELHYTVAGVVLSVFAGVSYPLHAIFFGNGIVSIADPELSTGGHPARFWALMYLVYGALIFGVYCTRGYCFAVSASMLHLRARASVFKSLLLKGLPFFDEKAHSTASLMEFISSDAQKIIGVSGTSLGLTTESLFMLVTGIIVGCVFGWKLGLASTATVPFMAASGFLQYFIVMQVQKYIRRNSHAIAIAYEAFATIRTVIVFGLQSTISEAFATQSQEEIRERYWILSGLVYACGTSFRVLSIAFIFWYGGAHLVATGEYSIQQFYICFAAIVWGSQSASTLFAHAPDIAGAQIAAERLRDLMLEPTFRPPEGAVIAPSTVEDVALEHVHFRYPSRPSAPWTLDNINLNARAGHFIGLVGATGSGKSSVVNLLERFYSSDLGVITLAGMPITNYDLETYYRYFALVDQNPCLVGDDLREALQGDDRVISDGEIMAVLESVGLGDLILSLPHGLSTAIVANGANLSGGQRQRIAIAKALLWKPKILLLDEATSALDTFSEHNVQQALRKAMDGRTTIAVAHRLKTIMHADEIMVFDGGRIIERGTHMSLMEMRGKYWEMVHLQELEG
ncbi:ABC transporter ATP-binding protein [Aspergillus homomorphus CBS 101889]|uniref:P-loop containing nucleoside triphosphate hydrolase protein n=1 Tax=Aspergillus homomorphus (strain CBS 101889) TaxID=1450537 RepID=A0A395HUJ5_ASPHC|nr:P-loop containing nucleoside triphosphate hydrolase protein [Aspergillus homomorphus CBS 101889]RAL11206.1 P-loop containing nucleoside triphosphate hydrolase protein [Aspergillus homomorphus CBS 101889]